MPKYYPQELKCSCAPSGLRNALSHIGINISEQTLRKYCNTTKNGTDEFGLMRGIEKCGLDCKEIYTKSEQVFKRRIIRALKSDNPCIVLSDNLDHWIAVLDYKKRKIKIVDTDFKHENKSIKQKITLQHLTDMCRNFDKFKNEKFYYFLEIKK